MAGQAECLAGCEQHLRRGRVPCAAQDAALGLRHAGRAEGGGPEPGNRVLEPLRVEPRVCCHFWRRHSRLAGPPGTAGFTAPGAMARHAWIHGGQIGALWAAERQIGGLLQGQSAAPVREATQNAQNGAAPWAM